MNANHELTTYVANMDAQSLSRLFSKCSKAKWTKNYVWGQHFFQIINVTNCSSDFEGIANELEATFAVLQGQQPRQSVLHKPLPCNQSLDWRGIHKAWLKEISVWSFGWTNHLNFNQVCLFNTGCIAHTVRCWGGNSQMDIAKEQGHSKGRRAWQKIIQSLSLNLNPLYQIEEDVGKISFNKSWGINMLVFYA